MARKKKGKKNGGNRSKKQNNGARSPVNGSPAKETAEVAKEENKKQVESAEIRQAAVKETTTDAAPPSVCNDTSAGQADSSNDKSEGTINIEEKQAALPEIKAEADTAMASNRDVATPSEVNDTTPSMEDGIKEKVDESSAKPKVQEELLPTASELTEEEEPTESSLMQETRATVEDVSNGGLKEVTSSENLDNSFEADSDAPTRFEDLETAYSWFADHVQDPKPPEVEIVFQDEDTTTIGDEDTKETTTLDSNAEIDSNILEDPKPLVKRNSLVGRVKTVNAEGDTDEEDGLVVTQAEIDEEDPWVTPDSNLRNPKRRICVVTTAALPWFTGTAVNPLLRALYLTRGRPKHFVTLVIPWCNEEADRNKTLGKKHSFANEAEQEAWIRDFCRTRANCEEEEKNLKIVFYPSNYNEAMGSIFPAVDICALIPDKEADIAILEEPEHLNWLRVPTPYKESEEERKQEGQSATKETMKSKGPATAKEKRELGWRFKFRHVVGIIHTNYKAYAEQYGIGVKFITAPALCALNALVVRAYCHKVILLSGTLPSLTPYKEITCNVHGVRGEFLERPKDATFEAKVEDEPHAPVYFIGKLIWAKGFDKILEVENMYREQHDDYFPIDVYGAGGDEKAIKRAFYGRIPQIQQSDSSSSDEKAASEPEVADVFTWEKSLRSHLVENSPFRESEKRASLDDYMAKRRIATIDPDDDDALPEIKEPPQTPKKHGNFFEELAHNVVPLSVLGNLSVSALDTTKATGGAAVEVVKNVVGAGLNVAFTTDFGSPQRTPRRSGAGPASPEKKRKSKLIFEPPQSIFEFRRNPIKARFLGTKDHVLLRDIAEHKIFLNMSITEVLCTTSAEAMAMGKFVILPKHPSNTFFMQFPNCLAYTSLEDCVEKLEWALANDPVPLSDECAKKLSWEGANERLFDSAAVTRDEWEEWAETGKLKSDTDAARFHVETGVKGQLIGNFFTGDKSKDKPQMKS